MELSTNSYNAFLDDNKLQPCCTKGNVYSPIVIVDQNLVRIYAVVLSVTLPLLGNTHDAP